MSSRSAIRILAVTFVLAVSGLLAPRLEARQQAFPLAPMPRTGLTVSPFFEGWYENPDGTYSVSLGYFNRNAAETLYIPRGPNNFIEPAEFDGFQPEHFTPRRVRGTFVVTFPASFAQEGRRVVWTLINRGDTLSVPAGVGVSSYELGYRPMAMGSLPPVIRFEEGGPGGRGPMGIMSSTEYTTSVGTPLALQVWVMDESEREEGELVPVGVEWTTHQGPAMATFSDEVVPEEEGGGLASATVTFPEPGEYVLRVQADVFSAPDSSSGNQCCWSNGYVRVTVTP